MTISILEDLEFYNSLVRGLQWWSRLDKECPQDIAMTYGSEGCKLRIKLVAKVKLLDFLLDGQLLSIANVNVDDLLGHVPNSKAGESCVGLLGKQMREGLEKMLCGARNRKFTPTQVESLWPYCKDCPPKGYNCMISLSYDFLDAFSDLFVLQKTVEIVTERLSLASKKKETAASAMREHIAHVVCQLSGFSSWIEDALKKPLVEDILHRRVEGKSIEEWILDEINMNFKRWEKLRLTGWPVVISGSHRKEKIDDGRGLLVEIIGENYSSNKQLSDRFKFLQTVERDSNFREFINSEAKLIDPLSTAFTIKYLISGLSSELVKEYFPHIEVTINECIKTIQWLYEIPFSRNTSKLELSYHQNKCMVFDGNNIPPWDGAWMNFEFIPDPSTKLPTPDYSLSSTLDVADTLMFIPFLFGKLESYVTKSVEQSNDKLSRHVIKQRLENAVRSRNGSLIRLDISHWQDRYHTGCDFSDIYGTIRMLDYLLNLSLVYVLKEEYARATTLLFETPFRDNLVWLIHQQDQEGFWPAVSLEILEQTLENKALMAIFEPYLSDLGFPMSVKDKNVLRESIKNNKTETISYANTVEIIALLSKYFATRALLGTSR